LPRIQLATLTRLERLTFNDTPCPPDGFSALLQLTSLTALHMRERFLVPTCLPACLPELSQLRSFHFVNCERQDAELAQALPLLQRLTALHLNILTSPVAAALPALPHLQALVCPEASKDVALPAGAWLAPLRWLVLLGEVLTSSLSVLGTARRLELVGAQCWGEETQQQLGELITWAGQQPQLRWLLSWAARAAYVGLAGACCCVAASKA
jgi:hypothetical protein